jgi:hypothetical protein
MDASLDEYLNIFHLIYMKEKYDTDDNDGDYNVDDNDADDEDGQYSNDDYYNDDDDDNVDTDKSD